MISRIDITNRSLNILRYFNTVFINSKQDINYFEIVSEFKDIIVESKASVNELKLLEDILKTTNAGKFWFQIGNLKNRSDMNSLHIYTVFQLKEFFQITN